MTILNRYQRQIELVSTVFNKAFITFNNQKPIDSWLSAYFRSNRKHGSKDRRLISSCIFGYFRWYGWIRNIEQNKTSLALLLGYLLDNNEITPLVSFWGNLYGLTEDTLQDFFSASPQELTRKQSLILKYVNQIDIRELNPRIAWDMPISVLSSFQTRPKLWIRSTEQTPKGLFSYLADRKIQFTAHPNHQFSFALQDSINLFEVDDYRKGKLEIQDLSSQGVGLVCNPKPGDIWWDVCAGSGGKSLHLAAMMKGKGLIYATETHQYRLTELRKRISRNDLFNIIKPLEWDGKALPTFKSLPDQVLIDAPCSCSGTWRRSPDIRWHPLDDRITHYSQLQLNLLTLASQILEKGGKIIYATCSIFKKENEEVVESFLHLNPEFEMVTITCPFTGNEFSNGIKFLPPTTDGNVMYVAVLTKKD